MRIFILFYCITSFSFIPETGRAQNAKINIEADDVLSVNEVFKLIKSQTNYRFIYPSDLFVNFQPVSVKKGTIRVKSLLQESLSQGDFSIELGERKTIIIRSRSDKFQEIIKGKVVDKNGQPIPGVAILLKSDQAKGTATDFNGNFEISVPVGETLLLSSIGYTSKEILIENQDFLTVIMTESLNSLDEVVLVSTGYQNISKERATGSFQNIEEKVLDQKISQNILSKIEGEIAGIVFDEIDGPTIRGISTINANNDPLIVVDGFPITQGINSINPNDIAKISVLKDAAAASIWGIRAANGVIVIITKKGGKNQKPSIAFSSNLSIQPKDDYSDFKFGSTDDYLAFEKHRADNEWSNLPSGTNQPPLGKAFMTYLLLNNGDISQTEADAIINDLRTVDNRDEFSDLFMANAIWTQQNLSVTGGGDYNTYRASVTYNSNENLNFFKQNNRDEILANISNSIQISPKLTFSNNLSLINSTTDNNGMSRNDYLKLDQYQRILDDNGNFVAQPRTFTQSYKDERVAEGYPYNWDYNLKQEFDEKDNRSNETLIRIQAGLTYELTDYLSLEGMYQYEWGQNDNVNKYNENTYYARDLVNTFTVFDTNVGGLVSAIPKGEIIRKQFSQNKTHSARFQFNLDKEFNDGEHRVNAIGGYEVRQVRSNFNTMQKYGYDPQSLTFANIPYGERLPVLPRGTRLFNDPDSFQEGEDRYISYYGNAAYTYNGKYTASGSIRLDDANLFGGNQEYRNIPLYSLGAKWDLHKEDFFNNDGLFNQLSLRATYGSNGNVDNGTSPFLQATIDRDYNTGNLYAYISDVKNPSLRLEKTFVTNLGVDFGIFNNRLNGSLEYYKRKSVDLLAPVSISSTLGFNTALINAGEMENTGFDLQLNANVIEGENFNYNSRLNFSYNKNEVTEVDVPQETVNTYLRGEPLVGKPLRYIYSYQNAGLDSNGDPLTYNENGELIDVNGQKDDGTGNMVNAFITDVDALSYGGTRTPKYYGAWINNLSYKKFNLRILTTFKMGHVFRNTNILNYSNLTSPFDDRHIHEDFENRWQNPGDEATTTIPRVPEGFNTAQKAGYGYYATGTQFVDSASHIRLKEIILGYQFDGKMLTNIGINQLGLSFQATNLAVFNFNKWDLDPESLILPIKPTYTFNLTATF